MRQRLDQAKTLAISTLRCARSFQKAGSQLVRQHIRQYIPAKPIVIQFPVNDICNSKCVMCDIWKRKRDKELTPDEVRQILRDPLFSEVQYVGINGGEPTLRKDLAEIGKALIEELPKFQSLTLITNAIRHKEVIARISELAEVTSQNKKHLSVSVSLDGVGEDHDLNRGIPKNFDSAQRVIEFIKQNNIQMFVGCTLTEVNCYGADDLLLWCKDNDIKNWKFRLGVEIKRVYNEGFNLLHPLTPEQKFHLIMFFDKLANDHDIEFMQRHFYKSLVKQLAFNEPRSAGCAWQTQGVTLDARGEISYCSVQSPILGSALEKSALDIYKQGLPERRKIIRDHCDDCQHDLTGPLPPKEIAAQGIKTLIEPFQRRWNTLRKVFVKQVRPAINNHPSQWRHVLITGWYGTETAGDKAILGEIVHFVKTHSPDCEITLTTIDRKVSQQTNLEIPGLSKAKLVNLDTAHRTQIVEQTDAVIVGGGPLQDINQLEYICRLFQQANKHRRARIVFGCGIGVFHNAHLRDCTASILQMTTAGFFRDQNSYDRAKQLGAGSHFKVGCDPALRYLYRWAQEHKQDIDPHQDPIPLIGLLRANTSEYVQDMDASQLDDFNTLAAKRLAAVFEHTCQQYQTTTRLLPMHSIWWGGDDRVFSRKIAAQFTDPSLVNNERAYLPINPLLQTMTQSQAAIAMRYHGHLFCMALGIPFLSIDYTGDRGKVASLIDRIGYNQWSIPWDALESDLAIQKFHQLMEEKTQWSKYLLNQTTQLVQQLEHTYHECFDKSPQG